jgi:proline racemase
VARYNRLIFTVDTHTGGQPTSTVVGGIPRLRGKTMSEKMLYMRDKYPELFVMLTNEPRGTKIDSFAILTEPTMDEADVGVIFFELHGFMPMCGHTTIGMSTMLVETGMVDVQEPVTNIMVETPNGLLKVRVDVENGRAKAVTFRNAPAFTYGTDMDVDLEGKNYKFDVAYGGNFYAIFDVAQTGMELTPDNSEAFALLGDKLVDAVSAKYPEITHPEKPYLHGVSHAMFVDPVTEENGVVKSKNIVILQPKAFDRSPCGTGTSARAALLYHKGILKPGQSFEHLSIIDSLFITRAVEELDFHGYKAIIPEVTGSARLRGFRAHMLDPDDEKGFGFLMG